MKPFVAAALLILSFCTTHVDAQVASHVVGQARPVPAVVNLKAYVATDGDHLDLLLRVPLSSVKNVQFPERVGGYLDVAALQSMAPSFAGHWIAESIKISGAAPAQSQVMTTRISIISDPSFDSYQSAREHFTAPDLRLDEQVLWQQVWLDVHFRYTIASTQGMTIEPRVLDLGVKVNTDLTIVDAGAERQLTFEGNPGRIYLYPRWHEAFGQFLTHGLRAVWSHADFVVFLLCLALPFRNYRSSLPATIAFSGAVVCGLVTLRLGLVPGNLWFQTLTDTLAALAIVLTAAANIVNRVSIRTRALFAVTAGFVFGMLCAFRFDPLVQFAGANQFVGGLSYGIGIMLAIATSIALLVPLFRWLFSMARVETIERIIVSALAADTAWSWLVDRYTQFSRVPSVFAFEAGTAQTLAGALVFFALLTAVLWIFNRWLKSRDLPLEVKS